jgi:hypothetical protein
MTNPNGFRLEVTDIRVDVSDRTSEAGCGGSDNYVAVPFTGDYPLALPPGTTRLGEIVPAHELPRLAMRDLPANQDGCRGAVVHLQYSGTATR